MRLLTSAWRIQVSFRSNGIVPHCVQKGLARKNYWHCKSDPAQTFIRRTSMTPFKQSATILRKGGAPRHIYVDLTVLLTTLCFGLAAGPARAQTLTNLT